MFKARAALQGRVYGWAAKLYRKGWDGSLRAPETDGTKHLHLLLDEDFLGLDPLEQADLLRRARYEDAGELLELVSLENTPVDELWAIGDFAYHNGHYDTAAVAYEKWFDARGEIADADILNAAAWQLYLARRSTDAAVEIARRSWETDQSADVADTLARLLYITGEVEEALELQRRAIDMASDAAAAAFREVLKLMEAGRELGDRPSFESFPQGPQEARSATNTTVI
jgi:tetratricopeptide (TPR) repeat protein